MERSLWESTQGSVWRPASLRPQLLQLRMYSSGFTNWKTRRLIVAIVSLTTAGCTTLQTIAENSPPAMTPHLTRIEAAPSATAALVVVPVNAVGKFEVLTTLPSGLPRDAIKVFFTASSLLTLKVDVEGTLLSKFAEVPSGSDPNVVGYYRVESVDASDNWHVTIRPPLSPIPRFALTINIATVSINPNYSTGPDHESAPLVIKLTAKRQGALVGMSGVFAPGGAPCRLVPSFPQLRPGLRVTFWDEGTVLMTFAFNLVSPPSYDIDGEQNSIAPANFPFPGKRKFSLVLRVGTQEFQGSQGSFAGGSFIVNQAGSLEFCVNDDNLNDNGGGWGVRVRVEE